MTGCQGCSAGRASLVVGAGALGAGVAYLASIKWFSELGRWHQLAAMGGIGGLAATATLLVSKPDHLEEILDPYYSKCPIGERLEFLCGFKRASDTGLRLSGIEVGFAGGVYVASCNMPEELPVGIEGWRASKQHAWLMKQESVQVQITDGETTSFLNLSADEARDLVLYCFTQDSELKNLQSIELTKQQAGDWTVEACDGNGGRRTDVWSRQIITYPSKLF